MYDMGTRKWALALVGQGRSGIEWKQCTRHGNPYNISVARKASVALMDAHVGPKY
jgi:hypothetical protein